MNNLSRKHTEQPIVIKDTKVAESSIQETNQLEAYVANQMDPEKWDLIARLVRNKEYKKIVEMRNALMKASSQGTLTLINEVSNARVKLVRERLDSGLKMIKAEYRKNVNISLLNGMQELRQEVDVAQGRFIASLESKYERIEEIKVPALKERFRETVDNELVSYLRFLDGLTQNFENIMEEELSNFK